MSNDPVFNTVSFKVRGDITPSRGQLGMTTTAIDTLVGTINQTPGAQYSDYYSHYLVNISAGNSADFNLAPISSFGVSGGYTACIDCLTTGSSATTDALTIKNSGGITIAKLWSGGKVFLTAVSGPNTWKTAYGVPEGRDNWLIVYTGPYPEVRTLPIQKEFYYDATYQYGIKCIQSFDSTELANMVDWPIGTPYTNLNRIVFEGCTDITTTGMTTLTPASEVVNFYAACDNISFVTQPNDTSVSAMIASYNQSSFEQLGASKGVFIAACNGCFVDNSLGNQTIDTAGCIYSTQSEINGNNAGLIQNSFVAGSFDSTVQCVSNINNSVNSSVISSTSSGINSGAQNVVIGSANSTCSRGISNIVASSGTGIILTSQLCSIHSGFSNTITNNILASMINCDTCTAPLTGDGVFTRGANGFNNNRAGITLLSSYNVPALVSAADLRYCVVGGYNAATWSIDSKTGIHYGSAFNNTQPLPGFAEMFENATEIAIPYGRLLQLDNGKVRLATNGESGFMISRPFESAAFVGGNPNLDWHKKYLTDQFGVAIMETITKEDYVKSLLDAGTQQSEIDNMELPDEIQVKKLNPNYDANTPYIARSDRRDQWTTCEKMGIVVVEYSGIISAGDYLVSGDDGIAKRTLRKSNICVLEIIDNRYAKVDITNQHVHNYVDEKVAITNKIVSSLPSNISIKDIQFADNLIKISNATRIKISVGLVGDILLSTDIQLSLVSDNNEYGIPISCSKLKNNYFINGTYRGVVQSGDYKLVFTTGKTLPIECDLLIKV